MIFVRPDSAGAASKPSTSAAGTPAGQASGGTGPGKETAEQRQARQQRDAQREESGPVAQAMRATAAFRLVDDQGQPLARRKGKAVLSDGREIAFTSGADGRFFIGELEPGASYDLVVDPDPSQNG